MLRPYYLSRCWRPCRKPVLASQHNIRGSKPCLVSRSRYTPYRALFSSNGRRFVQDAQSHQSPDPNAPTQDSVQSPSQNAVPSSKWRRYRWHVFLATTCVFLGLSIGKIGAAIAIPPPLPEPDSPDEALFLSKVRNDLNALPFIKELRANREDWLEYDAYMAHTPEAEASSLTAGAMQGSAGLAVQRVFWNKMERRLISVVFLGGALCGWPGVVHGGCTATLLQENLERVARGSDFSQAQKKDYRLDDFSIRYRKPASANSFYVIRAEMDDSEPVAGGDARVGVKATLESALTGVVCAESNGSCNLRDESGTASQLLLGPSTSSWSFRDTFGRFFG